MQFAKFLLAISVPWAWAFSWFAYACGCLMFFMLEFNNESELWASIWYPPYNQAMIISNEAQTWVHGTGGWWPWQVVDGDEQ